MSICNVHKVRQSQPHWQTPHNKKFVQAPHALGTSITHKYCISSREVRINLRTVVGPVVIYNAKKAVCTATLQGRNACGAAMCIKSEV